MATLRSLVETALTTALAGVGATVYAGQSYSDKVLPCVICAAMSAEEDILNSGNYRVTVEITVRDTASAASTFDTICAAVAAIVKTDSFAASLAGTAFTVWAVAGVDRVEWGVDGDSWTEKRTLELICAQNDFT